MANVDVTQIHQGPGKLWLGVSIPASGSRLIIDSSGTPTAGTPLFAGATDGAATVVLTPKLEEIILKSLEKDPEMRYQNASEIRTDLKRLKRDTDSGRAASRVQPAEPSGFMPAQPSSQAHTVPPQELPQTSPLAPSAPSAASGPGEMIPPSPLSGTTSAVTPPLEISGRRQRLNFLIPAAVFVLAVAVALGWWLMRRHAPAAGGDRL